VGESDRPPGGYDTSTRVEDIRCFLDTLRIPKTALIGHSMAGDELTLFATRHPDRVSKLVYLDAAYDRKPEWWVTGLSDPASTPGMTQRMRMEALGLPGAADIHVENMPPPSQWAILVATHKAIFGFRPDYTNVEAAALAFYAATSSNHYPRHSLPSNADAEARAKADEWWQGVGRPIAQKSVEQFRAQIPHGEIVELKDAQHYLFLGETAQEVARKIREFLLR
jgi:pimeloyl-ACP methyl ester carboxylesterase